MSVNVSENTPQGISARVLHLQSARLSSQAPLSRSLTHLLPLPHILLLTLSTLSSIVWPGWQFLTLLQLPVISGGEKGDACFCSAKWEKIPAAPRLMDFCPQNQCVVCFLIVFHHGAPQVPHLSHFQSDENKSYWAFSITTLRKREQQARFLAKHLSCSEHCYSKVCSLSHHKGTIFPDCILLAAYLKCRWQTQLTAVVVFLLFFAVTN